MAWRRLAVLIFLSPLLSAAQEFLVGYGNWNYDPICAQACVQAFRLAPLFLNCSNPEAVKKPFDPLAPPTPPSCYAQDTAFLTSVAWCIHSKCPDESLAKIEGYWQQRVSGLETFPPKWGYSIALDRVDPKPPRYQLTANDTHLNQTSLIMEVSWLAIRNGMTGLYIEEVLESTFSIVLIVVALGLPIFLTWGRVLPFFETVSDKLKPYLIYPSILGTYHTRPLPYLLGNVPTSGQTLYIVIFVILNVILTAVGYQSLLPNAFYITKYKELLNHITIRTGAFSFVLLPIMFLFSSRNNILLYLTDWSHSTFVLLHRWMARLFLVHVVIHSIAAFQIYRFFENTDWWYWGIVGTVLTVVMVIGSGLYVRKRQYELFLISHVVLAVLIMVGSWYHLTGWYVVMGKSVAKRNTLGYELWLYFAAAVWFFDRLVRLGRVLRWGPRRAVVTEIGSTHVRVDIPGVRWGVEPARHVFVYFPTLRPWAPWENHPFSAVPTRVLRVQGLGGKEGSEKGGGDEEKQMATARSTAVAETSAGITLFVRKSAGMTSNLKAHGGLLTFLDGPYSSGSKSGILLCDRVLLIAGGIGITGALPWAYRHLNVKLVWSVKEEHASLVDAVDLTGVATKEVRIGRRFNMEDLLSEEEGAGWARVGVVVAGPGSLCDDARAAVVAVGKRGKTVFELEVDAFSW